MRSFLLALQFLTRLPVPAEFSCSEHEVGHSVLYYPLVGAVIGVILLAVALLLQTTAATLAMTAALLLCCWVLLTGALHLDGLADCADAWAGGFGDRERSLAIMKDPAAGPVAVIILFLLLLLKWTALLQLLEQQQWLLLIITPGIGRAGILALMLSMPYVSPGGLAENLLQNFPRNQAKIVLIVAAGLLLLVAGIKSLILVVLMLVFIRHLAVQRLSGATGDVYGASVELLEITVLLSWFL